MISKLTQSAQDVVGITRLPVAIASGSTIATGVSTYNQWVPALLGSAASVVGIIVSLSLLYLSYRKK